MATHVVVGKGLIGSGLATVLQEQGHEVRVISRGGGSGPEHRKVDASDVDALTSAAQGADVLYDCLNPDFTRWPQDWPPLAASLLTAAERLGAGLVTMAPAFCYGPVDGAMTEATPMAAPGHKGRVRAQMWRDALAAHEAGRVRATEARASDFVGPGLTENGQLGSRVVPKLLAGKGVQVLGDPDAPHSWTDVRDVARFLAVLGTDDRSWGRAWHVPSPPPVSQREAVLGLCAAAGVKPVKVGAVPPFVLRALGLFVPVMREVQELRYMFERPFVLDSSAAETTFGQAPTPLEQTWADTTAWWLSRTGTPARPAA